MLLSTLSQEEFGALSSLIAVRGILIFENQQDFDISALSCLVSQLDPSHDLTSTKIDEEHQSPSQVVFFQAQDEWHTDTSCETSPPSISLLRIEGESDNLGKTAFVSQYGVYDSLSKPLQRFVDDLTAVHSSGQQSVEHPAVRTHPVSGLKALNVSPGTVTGFPGLNGKESGML
ncbi:hypothetical protein SLS60_003520 [Paraconiothyrium brasiliense]|uniref:TauD/TfdA-like domain-containing protein n=1 Tax=Paraconiothyrium brasiliense TaxID=300254 RepID=A0ABR3RVY0_9PLEO